MAAAMGLRPGERFGRYELVSRLGHGGMAETWRARLMGAAGVTKPVLIKRILPQYANDDAFISMFISEARISATLSHGNIAQVHDFGEVDGEYFLAMEYVDGRPLDKIIRRALRSGLTALPTPLATFITLELCRGLHYAHTRRDDSGKPLGIVHRDISPDNVLISYEGQIKIVDFGIAKARLQRGFNTEPGMVKGKYLYFSPEQARGEEVDARTDVWATGIVLYELLCGRLPVEGPEYAALPKLIGGEFPSPRTHNAKVPIELDTLTMKALSLRKEARFESSHAMEDALTAWLYSSTPRFSALSLSYFVQELFREDLIQEGRHVQVPASFLEELAAWKEPITAPWGEKVPVTQPIPPVKTAPLPEAQDETKDEEKYEDTAPLPGVESEETQPRGVVYIPTRVPLLRRHSGKLVALVAVASTAAAALAVVKLAPETLAAAWAWVRPTYSPTAPQPGRPPEAPGTNPPTERPDTPPVIVTAPGTGGTAPEAPDKPRRPGPGPKPSQPGSTPANADPNKRPAQELATDARALIKHMQYREASSVLGDCVVLHPEFSECRRLYIFVLSQLGEHERAKEQYNQLWRTNASDQLPERPKKDLADERRGEQ
jgi:serine/threonine protein kinase